MSAIDLTTPGRVRLAMELTTERRNLFRDLALIRQFTSYSRDDIAKVMGVRARRVKRFEQNPESYNPTVDFVLRYAHAIGARITMTAAMPQEAEETER